MERLLEIVDAVSGWIWGIPMLVILVGCAVLMTIYLGFFQFRYFGYICKETFGRMFGKKNKGDGTISAFQAAASALGACIGSGNIVGVGVAIAMGGPGAVFWMVVIGIVACALKYAEIALSVKYRVTNIEGEYVGGSMYYLKRIAPWFGTMYAIIFIFELAPAVGNQAASIVDIAATANIPGLAITLFVAAIIFIVVYGGVKRVANAMEKMVPVMGLIYIVSCLVIILINIGQVPAAFGTIIKSAFTGTAATGGFVGATVAQALRWGLARGIGSNDAGTGQSGIIHAAAITDHPARQGLWGVFEVLVDTVIVCTMSALVIVVTGVWQAGGTSGADLAVLAFQQYLGDSLGGILMTICLTLFSLSTIIVVFFYGEKLCEGVFGTKISKYTKYFYMIFVFLGYLGGVGLMVRFLDIMYAAIIIPNVIGIFILRKELKELTLDFFNNRKQYDKLREEKSNPSA